MLNRDHRSGSRSNRNPTDEALSHIFFFNFALFLNSFGVLSKSYLLWILKALCMHISNMFVFMSCLLSLIQYIGYTPSNPKWLRCAWNSNFISKYAHIYVECVLCIVVSLTTLDPISLGTKMYLNVVLGTLEIQWMLVSFIRKVVSPCDNWSQARMIDELLSTTSYLCYLGNKYLIHAYSSIIQPLVGCFLAWIVYLQMLWFLQMIFKEISLLHIWVSWDDAYNGEYTKSCSWFTDPKYVF
jgi:hypothetical protein